MNAERAEGVILKADLEIFGSHITFVILAVRMRYDKPNVSDNGPVHKPSAALFLRISRCISDRAGSVSDRSTPLLNCRGTDSPRDRAWGSV
jgi:hypothetical protein